MILKQPDNRGWETLPLALLFRSDLLICQQLKPTTENKMQCWRIPGKDEKIFLLLSHQVYPKGFTRQSPSNTKTAIS